ncbi:MAG: hypothetical protein ACRDZ1_17640 [Acidimicrobiia bacterium]
MRRLFVLLAACLAASALAAGPAAAGDDDKPKRPKSPKKAKANIEEAYTCFLSAALNYTIEQKLACVAEVGEDPEFLALALELSEANAAAAALTEPDVGKIKFKSKKAAEVTFDLLIGGDPVLPDQGGGAVFVRDEEQDKRVWKVSALTLCNLFSLANPALATSGPCADIIANDRV